MRRALFLTVAAIFVTASRADISDVAEIIRLHVAAIGGRARLDELQSFRGTGYVETGGTRVPFTMTAARPDRLRMDYRYPAGVLTQATDGLNPPWEIDRRVRPTQNHLMNPQASAAFIDDAEFDDPLLAARERGDDIQFAGRVIVRGVPQIKLLVARGLTRNFFLFVDAQTYWIVARVDPMPAAGGDRTDIVTEYSDFRPIGGILAAHRVTISEDGRKTEEAFIETAEANPVISRAVFTRPLH